MRMDLTQIAEAIDRAAKAKHIWNVDYSELKDQLGRHNRDFDRKARDIWLDKRDHHPATSQFLNGYDVKAIDDLYSTSHLGKIAKLIEQAKKETLQPNHSAVIAAYRDWVNMIAPLYDALAALKPYIVKGRKPSDDPTKTPPRTIDHTGTCPVCGRNIKIEHGVMYSHGFTVRGYREGNCFGVGYPPIEVSDKGARAFLGTLISQKNSNLEAIENLKKTDNFTVYHRNGSTTKLARGDDGFERAIESEIEKAQWMLRMISTDIKTFEEIVKNWKPTALPDGNKDHLK